MIALILAGGYATRLRPLSYTKPKILFPIAGKTIIERNLSNLRKHGVTQAVLATNYLAETIEKKLGCKKAGVQLSYSREAMPLGTGGPVRNAGRELVKHRDFLIMNGDVLADPDLTEMITQHRESDAAMTIMLCRVKDPSRFGVARIDEKMRILEFIEKPKNMEAGSLINAGFYIANNTILKMLPSNRKISLEHEIFPRLASQGWLRGFIHEGFWSDIGKIEDYIQTSWTILQKEVDGTSVTKGARIDHGARIVPPSIIQKSNIGAGAEVGPYGCIQQNTRIGENTRISRSIIFEESTIGCGCSITGAVIGEGVLIGDDVVVENGAVVSGFAKIAPKTRITAGVLIHPHKEISQDQLTAGHVV